MKTNIQLIAVLFFVMNSLYAVDPAYNKAMASQLEAMGEASTVEEFQSVANGFDRIAQMNPKEWLPAYYRALAQSTVGYMNKGDKEAQDRAFQLAQKTLRECIERTGENSELIALKGYTIMGELTVDPQTRGQELSGKAMKAFGRALKLDPENPRAMAMMAQMQLGMSSFFGEGPEKACGMAKQSLQLFEKEKTIENRNPFAPTWGEENAQQVITKCK